MKNIAGFIVTAIALIGAPGAYAVTTQSSQFQVNLTLQAACTITSSALNFGTQGVLTSAINQSTQLSVTCTNSAPYSVGLDAGNVTGSAVSSRLLQAAPAARRWRFSCIRIPAAHKSGATPWASTP